MTVMTGRSVIDTLADLVRIPSVNPNYAGGTGESEVADYIERFFSARGICCERYDVLPGRPNVIAKLLGKSGQRRIVLEAHTDTVSVAGMSIDPWDPQIREGKLYGRGACDTKAGLAAMMHALAELAASGQQPDADVWLAATIDEEFSYRGVAAICQGDFIADAAIVAEPTELQAIIASKGLVRWKIETIGQAAHSAKPHLGINAITHMAKVIAAIEQDTQTLADQTHPLLGPATCNIGVIRGGVQINFVPDRCEIEIDRRLLPGETVAGVLGHYQSLVDSVAKQESAMRVVMHPPMLTDVPLQTEESSRAVQVMIDVLSKLGLPHRVGGVPFCSDASKFGALGIPSLILGPGSIDQAHAAVEFVDCDQVHQAVNIYRQFILDF